jgi:hypothetical protein
MVTRIGNPPGKVGLGCLFSLFLLVAGVYVGFNFFEVYWRAFQLQRYVDEQASFAPVVTDAVIVRRLVAKADTLDVALGQRDWDVRRGGNPPEIVIEAQYRDSVVIEVLGLRKVFYLEFKPSARGAI